MSASSPHIVLLDLYHRGHHLSYIQMLCRYWADTALAGKLTVLVSEPFLENHAKAIDEFRHVDSIQWKTLSASASASGGNIGLKGMIQANSAHKVALQEAVSLNPSHIVCLFWDHAQLAIASLNGVLRANNIEVSGIFFRPDLHHAASGFSSIARRWRKMAMLKRALRAGQLQKVFCLNPLAVDSINALNKAEKAVFLPDGIDIQPSSVSRSDFRKDHQLEDHQLAMLLFGSLSARKGVFKVLGALDQLTETQRLKLVLIIAGKPGTGEKEAIDQAISASKQSIRIIYEPGYVPDAHMTTLFEGSDVALVAYQKHTGSSGILLRAAAAGIPVIGSDFGLVGHNIRSNKLGMDVDTTSEHALADAFSKVLDGEIPAFDLAFDALRAADFAALNTPLTFAQTIFSTAHGSD